MYIIFYLLSIPHSIILIYNMNTEHVQQQIRQSYLKSVQSKPRKIQPYKQYQLPKKVTIRQSPFSNQQLTTFISITGQNNSDNVRQKLKKVFNFERPPLTRKNTRSITATKIKIEDKRNINPYLSRKSHERTSLSKKSTHKNQKKNLAIKLQCSKNDWLIIKQIQLKSSLINHQNFIRQMQKIKTQPSPQSQIISQDHKNTKLYTEIPIPYAQKSNIYLNNINNQETKYSKTKRKALQSTLKKYTNMKNKTTFQQHQDKAIKNKINNSMMKDGLDLNVIPENQQIPLGIYNKKRKLSSNYVEMRIKKQVERDKNQIQMMRSRDYYSFSEYASKIDKIPKRYQCYQTLNGLINYSKVDFYQKQSTKRQRPKSSFVTKKNTIQSQNYKAGLLKNNRVRVNNFREMTGWQSHIDFQRQIDF